MFDTNKVTINAMSQDLKLEIAATAARLVVEDGLEYGPAKRRAAKQLGVSHRQSLPDNEHLEAAVRDYIAIYCAESQAMELRALRSLALVWMRRLSVFRPHLAGAVFRGTATRRSDIFLQLFCDDPKSAEIQLIDAGVRYDVRSVPGFNGDEVDALSIQARCGELKENVGIHLLIHDFDALRGALKADAQGRKLRGDQAAVELLLQET